MLKYQARFRTPGGPRAADDEALVRGLLDALLERMAQLEGAFTRVRAWRVYPAFARICRWQHAY